MGSIMSSKWIIYGLLAIALIVLMNLIGPFQGTVNSDFPDKYQPRDSNPIPPCPDSPNCARLTIAMEAESEKLLAASFDALREMETENLQIDSDSLRIDAIFQIPVFHFRDDFRISLTDGQSEGETFLHLSSRSRTGKSDLGVNRRRINAFLEAVHSKL